MHLDKDWALRSLRLFKGAQTATLPKVEQKSTETVPATSRNKTTDYDKQLEAILDNCFSPEIPRKGKLIPIPDQKGEARFFCKPDYKGDPAFWLDPKKWGLTLSELLTYMKKRGGEGVKIQVLSHEPAHMKEPIHESIEVAPIIVQSPEKYLRSPDPIEVTILGDLTIVGKPTLDAGGNQIRTLYNLGNLNPQTKRQKVISLVRGIPLTPPESNPQPL